MFKSFIVSTILSCIFFSYHKLISLNSFSVIEGVVTNEEKQPLQKAHVYIVLGEEEALTNDEGEFSFKTSQTFPLKVVIQREGYEDKTIQSDKPTEKLSIVLKHK